MKRLLLIIVFCAAAAGASAQEENPAELRDLRLFEYEFGYGINFGPRWDEVKAKPGNNLILEMRLNRPEPFDFGLQLKMGNFVHEVPGATKINSVFIRPSLFFDYNYRFENADISIFAGVGVGGSFVTEHAAVYISPDTGLLFGGNYNSFALTPRAGATFFGGVLRITTEYVITDKYYRCFNINLGFVIGGSYKPSAAEKRRRKNSPFY